MKLKKFIEIAIILVILIAIILVFMPLPGPPLIPPVDAISATMDTLSVSSDGSRVDSQNFTLVKGEIIQENQFDTDFDLVFDNLNLPENRLEIANSGEGSQLKYLVDVPSRVKVSVLCKSNGFVDVPSEEFLVKEEVITNCKEGVCCIVQFRRAD